MAESTDPLNNNAPCLRCGKPFFEPRREGDLYQYPHVCYGDVKLEEALKTNRELHRRVQKLEAQYEKDNRSYSRLLSEHENLKLELEETKLQLAFAESHAKGLELELKKKTLTR